MGFLMYPPEDSIDFDNASRGLITSLDPCVITSDTGEVIWDNDSFDFINDACPTDLANESLWRQSQLCQKQGLFEVTPGIYQVRGLDLANVTFVETPNTNGVVVIDPLTSVECARKALEMYQDKFPGKTIKALIYTHSHADHFGGASSIFEKAGDTLKVYAPDGFLEHAVSENVYAGNAMGRRSVYMYGESLARDPTGQIGCGLGMALSTGAPGMIPPTINIKRTGHRIIIDNDLEIVCQLTPGTEAPSEMNMYFPQYKALCMAENATHTLHNIQTLRGAVVRDARVWSRYLDESIVLYGKDCDVVLSSHHWPTWGNSSIIDYLSKQRDLYAYLNNETLRLLNNGMTGLEIAEDFALPPALENTWGARGYYGSVSHNVKAIYNRYMGWFDGNPAHLWEHPPTASAVRYVKCMGGISNVVELGKEYSANGDLRFAATLLSHAVFADQNDDDARKELQSVLTKLGYGSENATWRNIFLTGARELENANRPSQLIVTADTLLALDLDQLFDTIAIRIEGLRASKETFTIDVMVTDMNQGWHANMSNGALTGYEVTYQAPSDPVDPPATLTIWSTHEELVSLVDGERHSLNGLTIVGDATIWNTLMSLLGTTDPAFAIVTPSPIKTVAS